MERLRLLDRNRSLEDGSRGTPATARDSSLTFRFLGTLRGEVNMVSTTM